MIERGLTKTNRISIPERKVMELSVHATLDLCHFVDLHKDQRPGTCRRKASNQAGRFRCTRNPSIPRLSTELLRY
jgi:hypothetical protein